MRIDFNKKTYVSELDKMNVNERWIFLISEELMKYRDREFEKGKNPLELIYHIARKDF